MNGCNVDICWQYVKDNLSQVQQEIEDCKGMDGWNQQCQVREAAVVFFAILKSLNSIDKVFFFWRGGFTYLEKYTMFSFFPC